MVENWRSFLLSSTAAASPEEGVQGAETDVLYVSVNDHICCRRLGVTSYRTSVFAAVVTVEELGRRNVHHL